ncbi:predicted protein [Chaetomium globosum CBS 148.51]|uniref:Uncharacterized protein n=1 Tax=Chaetomium globosum (strain ATCC 6205 / CBS 148.51 / DSM 1962 / NBRC 6347 / NRRL 1970) TaxID=306901 RepID=Q2GRT8_CHAGB|nr:uncharacterized protein CHGG_09316 [Chaetomium globosum CBS 148.51]EAQ85302.1 predicted protein [Chaetomium globosum CBS 148.51]
MSTTNTNSHDEFHVPTIDPAAARPAATPTVVPTTTTAVTITRPPTPAPCTTRATASPPAPPAPRPRRARLVELDYETGMDLHNNTTDERALLRRMKLRVANVVSRARDCRALYAMRECVTMSIGETDLPCYRLEQLFYLVALDHINDLIREDEARNADDCATAMINNIPRTYDRYW